MIPVRKTPTKTQVGIQRSYADDTAQRSLQDPIRQQRKQVAGIETEADVQGIVISVLRTLPVDAANLGTQNKVLLLMAKRLITRTGEIVSGLYDEILESNYSGF